MIDIVHIGDFKTGTTWLQQHGFAEHPDIFYLGDPIKNVSEKLNRAIYDLCESPDLSWVPERVRCQISESIESLSVKNKITVLSREALWTTNYLTGGDMVRNAYRIREVFGNTKIIFIIREQKSMLSALYSQYIKMGGTLPIREFFFDSYETRGILDRLKYDRIIKLYQHVFGPERVYVDLFERFKFSPKTYLSDLYEFIGCTDRNFVPNNIRDPSNRSLTTGGVVFARSANRWIRSYRHHPSPALLPLDKLFLSFLPNSLKKRLSDGVEPLIIPRLGSIDQKMRTIFAVNVQFNKYVRMISEKIRFGRKIPLPSHVIVSIDGYYKDSNRVLSEKYNLPVGQFGWDI